MSHKSLMYYNVSMTETICSGNFYKIPGMHMQISLADSYNNISRLITEHNSWVIPRQQHY